MGWTQLESIALENDWKLGQIDLGQNELFRITNTAASGTYGKCVIAQVYGDPPSYYDYQSFSTSPTPKIFRAPFITEFYDLSVQTEFQRNFAYKFFPYRPKNSRLYLIVTGKPPSPTITPNWNVLIEVYI